MSIKQNKTPSTRATKIPRLSSKLSSSSVQTAVDPMCDENNPKVITFQDVCQAAFLIKGGVEQTPCRVRSFLSCPDTFFKSHFSLQQSHLSEQLGMEIFLKMEFLQFTGSFKERGVCNALLNLTSEQKYAGVVTVEFSNK